MLCKKYSCCKKSPLVQLHCQFLCSSLPAFNACHSHGNRFNYLIVAVAPVGAVLRGGRVGGGLRLGRHRDAQVPVVAEEGRAAELGSHGDEWREHLLEQTGYERMDRWMRRLPVVDVKPR